MSNSGVAMTSRSGALGGGTWASKGAGYRGSWSRATLLLLFLPSAALALPTQNSTLHHGSGVIGGSGSKRVLQDSGNSHSLLPPPLSFTATNPPLLCTPLPHCCASHCPPAVHPTVVVTQLMWVVSGYPSLACVLCCVGPH